MPPQTPLACVRAFDGIETTAAGVFKSCSASDACQYEFYSGLRGVRARIKLVELGLSMLEIPDLVGAVQSLASPPFEVHGLVDAYTAQILFGAWSSLECLVYAANAIGFAFCRSDFFSVDDSKSLKKIDPSKVWGSHADQYGRHFPTFHQSLLARKAAFDALALHHNVSKHRRAAAAGGTLHPAFIEAWRKQIGDQAAKQLAMQRATWLEILLEKEPGLALSEQTRDGVRLDKVVADYDQAFAECGRSFAADLKALSSTGAP